MENNRYVIYSAPTDSEAHMTRTTQRVSDVYGKFWTPETIQKKLRENHARVIGFRPAKRGDVFLEPNPIHGINTWMTDRFESHIPLLILRRP